jgi:hyperosmotically inducible periplasmic protein
MRTTNSRLLAVAAGCALLGLPALARADEAADKKLEDRIEHQLKVRKLGHVDVDVENGVATLKGEVATAGEKARAEKLAKVKGVTSVDSRLEVDPDKAKARIEQRADAKKEAVEHNAEAAKDRIEKQSEVAKDRVDGKLPPAPAVEKRRDDKVIDPMVTAKVKTKFAADDLVKAHTINVDTDRDGVVTLRGTVPSEAAHVRAIEITKMTDGVRKVNDQLKVEVEKK